MKDKIRLIIRRDAIDYYNSEVNYKELPRILEDLKKKVQ